MKKSYTFYFLILSAILLINTSNITAQTANEELKQADEYFNNKDFSKAVDAYKKVLEIDPTINVARYKLASSYYSLKKYDEAIKEYKILAPNGNPTVLYNLACTLSLSGKSNEALDYLEQAVHKGFKQTAILKTDTDLNNIRSDKRFDGIVNMIKNCENTPEFHQFDFWVGEWEAFNPQGQKAGDSRIERIIKGCVILENWTGITGFEGKSFNHYDPKTKKWYQYWIAENSNVTNFEGEHSEKDKAIIFYSRDHMKDANPYLERLTFFNIDSNTVRQFDQKSTDNGKTWTVQYDLLYKRKSSI